jgi:hypothetical protein
VGRVRTVVSLSPIRRREVHDLRQAQGNNPYYKKREIKMTWTQKNTYEISESHNIEAVFDAIREVLVSKYPEGWRGIISLDIREDNNSKSYYHDDLLKVAAPSLFEYRDKSRKEQEEEWKEQESKIGRTYINLVPNIDPKEIQDILLKNSNF